MIQFIKKYWKKHLLLIGLSLFTLIMMIYLKAYEGMIFLVIMFFICTGYIIIRDAERYDNELKAKEKKT